MTLGLARGHQHQRLARDAQLLFIWVGGLGVEIRVEVEIRDEMRVGRWVWD